MLVNYPVTYDGAHATPESAGTDMGHAIEFTPTTGRVYISGKSDETTTTRVNITTLAYNSGTGGKCVVSFLRLWHG